MNEKILEFPKNSKVLFNQTLKQQIAENIRECCQEEQADLVVKRVEDTICRYIVSIVMAMATNLGKAIGEKLASPLKEK